MTTEQALDYWREFKAEIPQFCKMYKNNPLKMAEMKEQEEATTSAIEALELKIALESGGEIMPSLEGRK